MTQLTYYPPGVALHSAADTTVTACADDGEAPAGNVRYGYTLRDLDHITRIAITWRAMYQGRDADERYACGWHAAVETLLTAAERPHRNTLISAAKQAADALTRWTLEDNGIPRYRSEARRTDMPRFHAYWTTVARHTASPEDAVVERTALRQIFEQLQPTEQEALTTLAATGSYQGAADMLGLKYNTFYRRVRCARIRFHALWLEGETPRRGWRDRRAQVPGRAQQTTSSLIRRRARAATASQETAHV